MEPRRILHIVTTMDYGGVETLLMTIYRQIDREKLQFDFLCHNRTESAFSDEIKQLGGRMFMVNGPRHGGFRQYINALQDFFETHPEYQIIHCHNSADNGIPLWQAKKAGVLHRISHSHIAELHSRFPYSLYESFVRRLSNRCLTERFACSKDAGMYLFGKNKAFRIMPNAISVDRFAFDKEKRASCRRELGIADDEILIGHVGRFAEQKNHRFLLRVFADLHERHPECKLLLLGAGKLESDIHALTEELGIRDFVIFGGLHSDLCCYYAAMDLFLFPSNYEGLGIVAVEAQCSGLPVVASNMVPKEAKITDRVQFLPLDAPIREWSDKVYAEALACQDCREEYLEVVKKSNYNISILAQFLQDYYLSLKI